MESSTLYAEQKRLQILAGLYTQRARQKEAQLSALYAGRPTADQLDAWLMAAASDRADLTNLEPLIKGINAQIEVLGGRLRQALENERSAGLAQVEADLRNWETQRDGPVPVEWASYPFEYREMCAANVARVRERIDPLRGVLSGEQMRAQLRAQMGR